MSLFKKKKEATVIIVEKEVPVMSKDMIENQKEVIRCDLEKLMDNCWRKGGYWNTHDINEFDTKANLYIKLNNDEKDCWLEMFERHFEKLLSIWEYNRRHPEEDVLMKDCV